MEKEARISSGDPYTTIMVAVVKGDKPCWGPVEPYVFRILKICRLWVFFDFLKGTAGEVPVETSRVVQQFGCEIGEPRK